MKKSLTVEDYQSIAEFRHQIRRYLRFSDGAVRDSRLEPRQYQLLLALKGLPPNLRPRIGELAEQLQIQHHSAVELVDRLEASGLVRRQRATEDRREVLVLMTAAGEKLLRELVLHHRSELGSKGPALIESLHRVLQNSKRPRAARNRN
ncbi:MAG TPA: MarR family transcriptional regulator [Terriglobales bacterium]|nr:MarR family transcriptional regulator [Terriglobales bacterium]